MQRGNFLRLIGSSVATTTAVPLARVSSFAGSIAGKSVAMFRPTGGGKGYSFVLPQALKWNPLYEVRWGSPHELVDVHNLARIIADPSGSGLVKASEIEQAVEHINDLHKIYFPLGGM